MQLPLRVPDSIWEGFLENIAKSGLLYYGHGVRESPMPDSRRDLTRQTRELRPSPPGNLPTSCCKWLASSPRVRSPFATPSRSRPSQRMWYRLSLFTDRRRAPDSWAPSIPTTW